MKNHNKYWLLAILMGFGLSAVAQNDVVRLKDGSIIRGTIIEFLANDHVRIKTEEGKVHEFKASDVSKTEVGSASGASKRSITLKTNGFYNITQPALMIGKGNYGAIAGGGFYTVNGWKFKDHFMTGLGVGIESFGEGGNLPIYLDGRYRISKSEFSPFVGVMAGYSIDLQGGRNYGWYDYNHKSKGGITFGGQLGFMANVGEHIGVTGSVGYRFQRLATSYNDYFYSGQDLIYYPVAQRTDMHRVTMSFGLMFE